MLNLIEEIYYVIQHWATSGSDEVAHVAIRSSLNPNDQKTE